MSLWQWFLLLVLVFWVCLYLPLWGSTEVGGNCVQKNDVNSTHTFEWLCADKYGIITLTQSDNIKNCYTCFLKKFSDWTWEQEKRLGIREDPKYITCRRYKRKNSQERTAGLYIQGANDTYTLVVEGQCPTEYRCKYDPKTKEPNIDSVVDSLNDSLNR